MGFYRVTKKQSGEGIPLITKSGSIVSFDDSVGGVPINSLEAEIVPVQAQGTPSQTNPLPISGYTDGVITRTGKNLWNNTKAVTDSANQNYVYVDGDGWLCFYTGNNGMYYKNLKLPQITLSMKLKSADSSTNRVQFIANYSDGTTRTFIDTTLNDTAEHTVSGTTTAGKTVVSINTGWTNTKLTKANNIQLEFSSSATAFEPFNGQTESRSFGQTVYGGTWKASEGKVVNEYNFLEFSSVASVSTSSLGVVYWIMTTSLSSINGGVMSDYFKKSPDVEVGNSYVTGSGNILVACPTDQTLNTKALANDWCATNKPHFLVPLATPTEIYVDPVIIGTLEGNNKVFANTGDLDAVFYKSSVSNLAELVEQSKALGAIT